MSDFLTRLSEVATSRKHELQPEAHRIRGVWRTNYVLRLTGAETILHLNYVIVQTVEQGCCYFETAQEEPGLSESLLGADAFDVLHTSGRSMQIAVLDAMFGSLSRSPDATYEIHGYNFEKAHQRAAIVCDEAVDLAKRRIAGRSRRKLRILNVGVIGSVLARLAADPRIAAYASDYYQGVAGKNAHGIRVEWGSQTLDLVSKVDVAIITGMTLANNTLDAIFARARASGTSIVLFAETGAHFGAEYCDLGIDVVVSEPFPFYLTCSGSTKIDVYRRESGAAPG